MPPRLNMFGAGRSLAVRTRPSIASHKPVHLRVASSRGFADEKDPKPASGPNQDVLPHVSEEAAELGEIMGETRPEIEQGTPVSEILQRDEEGKEKAPQVIQEEIGETKNASGVTFANLLALGKMGEESTDVSAGEVSSTGHKYPLPNLPLPSHLNLKHRYDPIVTQVTNLLMKDGKKSVAQRNMSFILNHLRTSPPPTPKSIRPLLPGSPPASHLPLNPIQYLTIAIDSVAPLLRIRNQKGAAGGGQALQIPVPLGLRQRRRTAMMWILDAANKKQSRGSGRGQFARKVAEEIIGVVEGRSTAWEKRAQVHKMATGARANIGYGAMGRRR